MSLFDKDVAIHESL